MTRDLRNDWQGRVWSLRRLPSHWRLETPTDWRDVLRAGVWLVMRTVAVVGAVIVLLALAAAK